MSKEKTMQLKIPVNTAMNVLEILETSTKNYSSVFPPERIVRLRELMKAISLELQKHNL